MKTQFHGWKISEINGLWNCKPLNCDYPIQSFKYPIDAFIYCKQHPNQPVKKSFDSVLGIMAVARKIRSCKVYTKNLRKKINNNWKAKYLDKIYREECENDLRRK